MKKRLLSFALALVLVLGLVPTAAFAVSAESAICGGATGTTTLNDGTGSTKLNAATDTSVDYCSILGISKATAEKFGETVRKSFRNYDFDVDVSSLKINVNGKKEENAFNAMMEHEVFYAYDTFMFGDTNYNYNWDAKNNLINVVVKSSEALYTRSQYETNLNTVHLMAEYLLQDIRNNKSLTPLQKALLLHDRLAAWAAYDTDNMRANKCPEESYSAYGILWKQVGVCQGYAEVYAYLLDQVGIPNRFAQSNKINHIWNIVTIGGKEYYVDVTWDDPSNYDLLGQVNHDHFLISAAKLRASHQANGYYNVSDYSTIPAANNAYDVNFWKYSHSEFQLMPGNVIYYWDNENPNNMYQSVMYKWTDGTQLPESVFVLNLSTNYLRWTDSNGYYYTNKNFTRLTSFDGKLYFNSAKQLFEYDPITGYRNVVATLNDSAGYKCFYGLTGVAHRLQYNLNADQPTSFDDMLSTRYIYDLKTLNSVELAKKPSRSIYKVGEGYDWRGITLKLNYSDGTSSTIANMLHSWNGWNSATTGTKEFSASLFNKQFTFSVKVIDGLATPKVSVKNTDAGTYVSWGKVKNATTYIVYRSLKSGGKWSDRTKMSTTKNAYYTDKTAKAGKVYRYMVRAWVEEVSSGQGKSAEVRRLTTPKAKSANAASGVYVSWGKVTGATKYAVYRSYYKSGKWTDWKQIGTTTKVTYTDKNIKAGTFYRYAIKAVNGSQKSASGTTSALRRLSAVNTTAKKSGSTIKVTWKKVSSAKTYVVYRRLAGASTWTKMSTTKTLSYTDKTAKKGKYYEYSVRAVNGDDMGAHKACKKVRITASDVKVWVISSGTKYHKTSSCSNMKNPKKISLETAEDEGYAPCSKCY